MAAVSAWQKFGFRQDPPLFVRLRSQALRFCNECMRRTVATLVEKGKFEQAEHRISRLIASGLVPNMWDLIMWAIRRAKPHLVDYLVVKSEWFQLVPVMHIRAADNLPLSLYPRFPVVANVAIVDVITVIDILVKYGIKVLHSRSLIRNTTTPGQHLLVDCWRKYILDFSKQPLACRQQLSTNDNNDDLAFLAEYDTTQRSVRQALNQVLFDVARFPCPVIAICAGFDTTFDRHSKCVKEGCGR